MADDDIKYEVKEVRAIRGTEARAIKKWQEAGWELVTQSQGQLLQSKLTFRRPKPKTPWLWWGIGLGVLLVMGIIIAVNAILSSGATPAPNTSATEAMVVPTASATASKVMPSEAAEAAQVDSEQILTVENNAELAALLADVSPDLDTIQGFVAKYKGVTIEFDGNIAFMNNHESYKTRYDILVHAGNYSETSTLGPNFQFKDVNITDLNLGGANVPDSVGTGDNVRVVARIEDFNSIQELLFLEPISTEMR